MPANLLTDPQHRRAHNLYFKEDRSAGELCAILNAEYADQGLSVTPRQITEYCSTRSWGAKRKALKVKGEAKAGELINSIANAIAERKTENLSKHQDFLEKSARVGGAVLEKAQKMIENTASPRDLASAANAAARGIEIYRKAVGLDEGVTGAPGAQNNFYFDFARGPGSPFYKPAEAQKTSETTSIKTTDEVVAPVSEETLEPHESAEILTSPDVG